MQGNSVISLRPALGMWRVPRDLTGADPDALYGCVDWFLYHEVAAGACSALPACGEPARMNKAASPSPVREADAVAPPHS